MSDALSSALIPANALRPAVMLASSMHAQPGVYALMLGSGVSTGAGVLTGWGIVQELVRRVAAASLPGDEIALAEATDDPEKWWADRGEGELGYASLLERLAPTPAARQGLLAGFFEPAPESTGDHLRGPSKAHHAIAQLVKRGVVRVIITTNFDRLMEQALRQAGVEPQVISRPEATQGMAPLAHATATIIKLHGDYKDLGTRNTPEELDSYPEQWHTLLRQVFDEYGLLVSGWSADWDTALVAAIETSGSRRYPLYWDSRSSNGPAAQRLLALRSGQTIDTPDADALFTGLAESIDALERLSEPPLTTAMAIARLKKYLPDPIRRMDLYDLVMNAVTTVTDAVARMPVSLPGLDSVRLEGVYREYEALTAPLAALLAAGVWHDSEGVHEQLWVDAVQQLVDAGTAPLSSAISALEYARLYPALICLGIAGICASRRDREALFIRLATQVHGRRRMGNGDPEPAAQLLHPGQVLEEQALRALPRWSTGRPYYPASIFLRETLRPLFQTFIPIDDDFQAAFRGFEYRLGLVQGQPGYDAFSILAGEYVGERAWTYDGSETPLVEIQFREQNEHAAASPWAGFLGGGLDAALLSHREKLKPYRGRH